MLGFMVRHRIADDEAGMQEHLFIGYICLI